MAATRSTLMIKSIVRSVVLTSLSPRVQPQAVLIPSMRLYSTSGPTYSDEYFANLVKSKPLILFMKGSPSNPMCGFSRLVVQILHMHGLKDYEHYDILEDMDFKEGMKKWSNWPTFPQVYMNGELVGGADIMLQLHQNGDLVSEFEKIGHRSALLDAEN